MPNRHSRISRHVWVALSLVALLPPVLGPGCAAAQAPPPPRTDVRLQGVVVDAQTYQPVRAATVTLLGTDMSVKTGRWGSFAFPDAPLGAASVRVSAPGHPSLVQDVEVRSDRIAFVQVVLPSIAATLAELLVDVGRFPRAPGDHAQSAADLLALEVPRSRANAGMVGDSDFQLRLRDGTTLSDDVEPLILIDGVLVAGDRAYEALLGVPAADVEEIQVLKGPAAASLYPYAANGVVRVTTKRGRARAGR